MSIRVNFTVQTQTEGKNMSINSNRNVQIHTVRQIPHEKLLAFDLKLLTLHIVTDDVTSLCINGDQAVTF